MDKIRGISNMLKDIAEDFGGGNDVYTVYKAMKLDYLKHEMEHPDFCAFIETTYIELSEFQKGEQL